MPPERRGLYVDLPDTELRWALRRAALDRRITLRELVLEILTSWLAHRDSSRDVR
jgi:hypothetical protein